MKSKWLNLMPSVPDALFLAVFASLALASGGRLLGDSSTGFHIRAGEVMWDSGSILKHDVFSFHSPPLPWTAHEWLAEVIMALIHRPFGLTGIVVFFSLVIALTYHLLFRMAAQDRRDVILGLGIVVLVMVSSQIHWLARPHAFSFVLTTVWYWILDRYEIAGRNHLLWLPGIMLVWVNLHGGFMFGFVLLGLYFACNIARAIFSAGEYRHEAVQKARHLGVATIACVAASLINPSGYEILLFPFKLVGDKFLMDNIMEYASPNFHQTMPFRYLLYLTIAILGLSTTRLTLVELALLVLLTHMALYGVRYIPLFGIIATPILVRHARVILEQVPGKWSDAFEVLSTKFALPNDRSRSFWAAGGAVAIIVCAAFAQVSYRFDPEKQPVASVEFLRKANLQGNMFNNDFLGDYLVYAAWPQYKVFVDGRQDMYGPERLREYDTVTRVAPGWNEILAKYRVEWVFSDTNSALSARISRHPDWEVIYTDGVASIFVRKHSMNDGIIQRITASSEVARKPDN
ncbi:MAG TPA: hypothetical protein VNL14_12505 [Candidatus Acidoferrales bacterium]|nr:hypothetical protein [Candidatus Acidoferrales bacterium]